MKELFVRPGTVAREFNAGQRKKYFNPITYLLIVMALQIFLTQKTGINSYYVEEIKKQTQSEANATPDPEVEKSAELLKVVNEVIQEHSKLINFLFLPVLALLTWAMFRRAGNNYAEVLVLDVLWIAQILLIFIILCIIPFFIYPQSILITMNLYAVVAIIYMIIALKQFFLQPWFTTIWKGIVIQLLYYIAMFVLMVAVVSFFFML